MIIKIMKRNFEERVIECVDVEVDFTKLKIKHLDSQKEEIQMGMIKSVRCIFPVEEKIWARAHDY